MVLKDNGSVTGIRRSCIGGISATLGIGVVGLALRLKAWWTAREVETSQVWDSATQDMDQRGRAFADASTVIMLAAGVAAAITVGACWYGATESTK